MTLRAILVLVVVIFTTASAHAQIPKACAQYQRAITREVQRKLGPAAPVAVFGGQMMQESSCNAAARSRVGAEGAYQFMPKTAKWMTELDASLSPVNAFDAEWAIRANVVYMLYLLKRNPGATQCDNYAFAEMAYNGGELWVRRDKAVTAAAGRDPLRWLGHMELYSDKRRAPAMVEENKGYPRRILLALAPRFVAAGWGRTVNCGN